MRKYLPALVAISLLVLLAGSPLFAQSARPSQNVPDVYVASNNSFVITVPNLTKVAVGDPSVVTASVVSPTEVLVQGSSAVSRDDGKMNFSTSNVFVWSGERRFVYRVVVIEIDEADAYPYGVDRIDVEPNKVIFRGASENVERTKVECRIRCEALGLKYEIKVEPVQFVGAMTVASSVKREVIEDAITRRLIIAGMTIDDLKRSRGELPAPYYTEPNTTGIIDYYKFEDAVVGVMNGIVIDVKSLDQIPAYLMDTARENQLIIKGMTDEQVISILGAPPAPPTVTEINRSIFKEYAYPRLRIITQNGLVSEIMSNNPLLPTSVSMERQDLGYVVSATGQTLMTRAYRLQYISGADLDREIQRLAKAWNTSIGFTSGYSADGLFVIVSDTATVGVVDSLVSIWDRPVATTPMTIQETKYTVPAGQQWNSTTNSWDIVPSKEVGFLMARFSNTVSEARRKAVADELAKSIAALPVIPFSSPLSMNLSGITLTVTGVPEQVTTVRNVLEGMIPDLIGKDITAAVAQGVLIPGMTRQQIESARGVKLSDKGRKVELSNGGVAWLYDIGDRAVLLSEDILIEERVYPTADEVRNAVSAKRLIQYLKKEDVEKILGQAPQRVTRQENNVAVVNYAFGEALYWNDRLESMNGIAGSEMQRLGIAVVVPRTNGEDFQLLTPEEQQTVMRRGIVMTGMTERDVARVVGQAPFNIKPGEHQNEKVYVYSDYEVTFREGIATKVNTIGEGTPRIIALRSRRATDMVNLILSSFANMNDVGLTADTISNRLIVRATNDKFIEIERFAKAMDQQEVPQVLIEAKFVEMNRTVARQLGVQWGLSTQADGGNRPVAGFGGTASRATGDQPIAGVVTGTTGSQTAQTITLGGDAGMLLGMLGGNGFSFSGLRYTNVDVMISAMESAGDAEVLSSPRIVTLNNQEALIKSVTTVQDQIITVERNELGQPISSTTTFADPKGSINGEVGVQLKVTPTVGADGIITMRLEPYVTRIDDEITTVDGSVYHRIGIRQSLSTVMVRSGTPLVIGGLSSRDAVKSEQKVPFLGNIPILGNLFRTRGTTGTHVDLLIFLTARIVPPDGSISPLDAVLSQPRPMIPNPAPTTTLDGTAPAARAR